MCGIAGFIDFSCGTNGDRLQAIAARMTESLLHRGPDDGGIWMDPDAGVALGHRRLSILDLSPQGRQPMRSECGRYVIVFNGEIYNHNDIRRELDRQDPTAWRGRSDTEVMLAAISRWGVESSVERFNGMFAFALWDRTERSLHLVRDRLGEKPLYYGWSGTHFLFGSELKPLRRHPQFEGRINRNALALYMRHNYVPAPHSIYEGIFKLPPATILKVGDSKPSSPRPYWSAEKEAVRGMADPVASAEAAVAQLDVLIRNSVKLKMEADVPLGAFLSGGIDSSVVVAAMQAQSSRSIKTFTIGFNESAYDEAVFAKAVAGRLGTDHTELYVTPQEAQAVIPKLPTIYDEPFSDSSQIPTFLVSQLARRQVTVSMSGDGGDELFGGYNRYFWGNDIWTAIGWLPPRCRAAIARGMTAVSPAAWDRAWNASGPLLPPRMRQRLPGDKIHKLAGIIAAASQNDLYRRLISQWENPSALVLGCREPDNSMSVETRSFSDFSQRMMIHDTLTYLPDDILVKVDRASMAVSLESRVPFLDHRIVEFAWRVPMSMKIRSGQGKWILKQVLARYIPKTLIDRPKMGFGVPIGDWLHGPLREWAEALLDENRLREEGFFDPKPIREKWAEHLTGKRKWQHHLWTVLMFQAWLENERARG